MNYIFTSNKANELLHRTNILEFVAEKLRVARMDQRCQDNILKRNIKLDTRTCKNVSFKASSDHRCIPVCLAVP